MPGGPSAIPGVGIIRPKLDHPKMSQEKQEVFMSAVGKLLYLVKNSRPDISNSVREL